MPLFKVKSEGAKRVLLKAESLQEIIKIAKIKLNLSEEGSYRVQLNDGTEIDEDEILLEYAAKEKEILLLSLVDINAVTSIADKLDSCAKSVADSAQVPNVVERIELISQNETSSKKDALTSDGLNIDIAIWSQLPSSIIEACKKEEELCYKTRRTVIDQIVNYMIYTLNSRQRSVVREIAKSICNKYPKSFADIVDVNGTCRVRHEKLFQQIYNALLYKSSVISGNCRRRKHVNSDSDGEDQSNSEKAKKKAKYQRRKRNIKSETGL